MNSQHDINGWTALHWAAKRNHLNIVNKLLNHGADKAIKTNKGEVPASLTSENVIKVLLSASVNTNSSPAPVKEEKLAITPNYIKNPVLAYKVDTASSKEKVSEVPVIQEKRPRLEAVRPSPPAPRSVDSLMENLRHSALPLSLFTAFRIHHNSIFSTGGRLLAAPWVMR